MNQARDEVSNLVQRWNRGDETALDRLIALAYDDLRQIAHRHLRVTPGADGLATTALVHELYIRLAGIEEPDWGGRAQFFSFCSKAMRHVLIDQARRRNALKRGGVGEPVTLEEGSAVVETEVIEVLAVDEALRQLEAHDERMARIVECRYFGGLTVAETADAVGASPRTVEREWARARAYLMEALSAGDPGG